MEIIVSCILVAGVGIVILSLWDLINGLKK